VNGDRSGPAVNSCHSPYAKATAISLAAATLLACNGQSADSIANQPDTNAAQTSIEQITSEPDRTPRVVGGTEVDHNKYPWMAAVMQRNAGSPSDGQFCGGSLIAGQWVLTAAHCIEDTRAGRVSVLLGQRNLAGGSGASGSGETINVSRIIIHPDYARQGYPDLALLELANSSNAQPITLPSRNNPVPNAGESATVTGWGQISETGPATNELRESTMPVVGHDQCNSAYNGEIVEDAMVCAGTTSGDKDSCYGDSGGPLFVKRGPTYVQAGVVSFGEECGLANVPGVYARVSSYHDWISAYAPVTTYSGSSETGSGGDTSDNGDTDTDAGTDTDTGADTDTDTGSDTGNDNGESSTDNESVTDTNGVISTDCSGLTCSFTANTSGIDFYWEFGDGYGDEGQSVSHEFDYAGDYEIYLGVITNTGDYAEHLTTVTVDAPETAATASETFNGRLRGWGDQADLPENGDTLQLATGNLTATLSVPGNRRFMLFFDRYDADTGDWIEQKRVRSRRGEATIEMAIEAGEYGFTVLSLGRGGKYELVVNVEP